MNMTYAIIITGAVYLWGAASSFSSTSTDYIDNVAIEGGGGVCCDWWVLTVIYS